MKGSEILEFKDALKHARLAKGLTQEELGQLVGLKKSAIYKYENGLILNPGITVIYKFAHALQVSPCSLIFPDELYMDSISDDEKKVLLQYRTLNIFGKRRIHELMEFLMSKPDYRQTGK